MNEMNGHLRKMRKIGKTRDNRTEWQREMLKIRVKVEKNRNKKKFKE